jgi:2,3-bisphosphoglycerate-dependent phosphoglycerate mutase
VEIMLIRHGQTERVEGADGPADPPLTQEGRDQAGRLAAWLAHEPVDHVVTSTLRRARETAAPLAAHLGLEAEVLEGLSEFDANADSYIPIEELRATRDPRFQALVEGRWDEFGDAPEPEAFRASVVETVERLVDRFPSRLVAVVCHGAVINLYLGHVLGLERLLWFEPNYASISRVRASRGGVRSVVSLNETAHLEATRG